MPHKTKLVFGIVFLLMLLAYYNPTNQKNTLSTDDKYQSRDHEEIKEKNEEVLEPSIQRLLDELHIEVNRESMEQLDANTFKFNQVMKIESAENQKRCINDETRAFNRSKEFNCSIFESVVYKIPKVRAMDRKIYFDKLCAPEVTVNSQDNTVETQTFSRCSYFEYSNRTDGSSQFEWVCMFSYVTIEPPKTGSTSLFYTMTSNPFINRYSAGLKEPNFMGQGWIQSSPVGNDPIDYLSVTCDIKKLIPNHSDLTKAIEEASLTNSIPTVCSPIICGDHSTQYSIVKVNETLQYINTVNPDTKYITLLREPVSRVESDCNFFSGWVQTSEQYENHFDKKLTQAKDAVLEVFDTPSYRQRAREEEVFPLSDPQLCEIAEKEIPRLYKIFGEIPGVPHRSFYWLYLKIFLEQFDRSDIFVLFSENMKGSQEQENLNKIFSFLGVSGYTETNGQLQEQKVKPHQVEFSDRVRRNFKEIMAPHTLLLADILSLSPSDFPDSWQYSFDPE